MIDQYDVIIIGGGPAGNSAALYTARAELHTLVLDKPGRGGSLAAAQLIANYPGVPGPLPGAELVSIMRAQAEACGAEYRAEVAISVQLDGDLKTVYTSDGGEYQARALILAAGALERRTRIPGEEEFLGRGVSTCVTCDAIFYRGKTTIVTGSDDFAAEEALSLARYADKVIFLIPTHKPMISAELLEDLQRHPLIEVRLGWRVREISGDDVVRGAQAQGPDGETYLAADGVFLYLNGAKPTTGFLYGQLALNDDGAVIVDRNYATSIPRVYAIGDITANHICQAIVAAAEGCIAALAVDKELHSRTRVLVDYH